MAVSERERHELHQRLDEVLGDETAATLMAHLPPVGWADVATKHDLAQLKTGIEASVEAVEVSLKASIEASASDLRAEFHSELRAVTRTYVLANIGLVFTVAAIALGVA